ncbi:MAG: aminotransferase class V-fold PLP-dependent enzyme, partial [Clostridia bacterium]|nr:aminotransferase class V-fold PLP-dependent enzyme [Clostridia bacterium]
MIYLDNAATSFVKPKIVKQAVTQALDTLTANPGRSGHFLSQNIAQRVFETREKLKKFFNAPNHEVVFTKNCTEALNLALRGFLKSGDHVITTCYEHNSVLRTLKSMEQDGVEVTILDCDLKDFAHVFEREIKPNTTLVVTTFVSNVTGEITDVKNVGKLCKKHGINYLVDGAQACGHLDVDLQN